jgi:hypothetical protein
MNTDFSFFAFFARNLANFAFTKNLFNRKERKEGAQYTKKIIVHQVDHIHQRFRQKLRMKTLHAGDCPTLKYKSRL